jgi:hypothetical protein
MPKSCVILKEVIAVLLGTICASSTTFHVFGVKVGATTKRFRVVLLYLGLDYCCYQQKYSHSRAEYLHGGHRYASIALARCKTFSLC